MVTFCFFNFLFLEGESEQRHKLMVWGLRSSDIGLMF